MNSINPYHCVSTLNQIYLHFQLSYRITPNKVSAVPIKQSRTRIENIYFSQYQIDFNFFISKPEGFL